METSFGACRETMGGLWVVMSVISYQLSVISDSVTSYQ
ncbi:hypothetical protein VL20_2585 [Microcystis panniformis FACHB-1757]|uniref:Uncharacterized protein n=1 Tax=Microcystis panniformis FACHB-1757 TaxID=1638788 RepID=A0A0K1S0K0_9CHRO|nr:hypothetical protein VL20_2585 [Microcystis panniformis FACHB-1757]